MYVEERRVGVRDSMSTTIDAGRESIRCKRCAMWPDWGIEFGGVDGCGDGGDGGVETGK